MAWLREIELEFVDIIVMSDNEPALTSLIESWSTLKSGSRMIIKNPFCWKIEEQGGRLEGDSTRLKQNGR